MLKCVYVVLMYNNEDNVAKLLASLRNLNGNFRKEFIFVDDGSSDRTLEELKKATSDLARATIITQEHQGSSASINKALGIAHGDYVHFVSGEEILNPNSTVALLDACSECDAEVAIGTIAHEQEVTGLIPENFRCLMNPFEEILTSDVDRIRQIGGSATLVSKNLLDHVGNADSSIYSHLMSLSLRCSLETRFAIVPEYITYSPKHNVTSDKKFDAHNNLRAIYNFIRDHEKEAKKHIPSLMKGLANFTLDKRSKIKYTILAKVAKYLKTVTYKKTLSLYKKEYEKLF